MKKEIDLPSALLGIDDELTEPFLKKRRELMENLKLNQNKNRFPAKKVLLIAACVALIAGTVAGGFLIARNSRPELPVTEDTSDTVEIPEETQKTPMRIVMDNDFIVEDGTLVSYTGDAEIVKIPEGVTKIGKTAFLGCRDTSSIKTSVLSSTVEEIEDEAFEVMMNRIGDRIEAVGKDITKYRENPLLLLDMTLGEIVESGIGLEASYGYCGPGMIVMKTIGIEGIELLTGVGFGEKIPKNTSVQKIYFITGDCIPFADQPIRVGMTGEEAGSIVNNYLYSEDNFNGEYYASGEFYQTYINIGNYGVEVVWYDEDLILENRLQKSVENGARNNDNGGYDSYSTDEKVIEYFKKALSPEEYERQIVQDEGYWFRYNEEMVKILTEQVGVIFQITVSKKPVVVPFSQ